MQTVFAPGLVDRSDANPPMIFRIMTPCSSGKITSYSEVSNGINTLTISGVIPAVPAGIWAANSRKLGVRQHEVKLSNPPAATDIRPAVPGEAGGGMSVLPVLLITLLANHRIPKRNGGTGSNVDCWFSIPRDVIVSAVDLRLYFDLGDAGNRIAHGVIEPGLHMSPADFSRSLSGTAARWICINF